MPQFFTYRKDVPLTGGATLGFTAGKGYYAKPAVLPATPGLAPGQRPGAPPPMPGATPFTPGKILPPSAMPGALPPGQSPIGGGPVTNPGPNYGADLVGSPDYTEANANYTNVVNSAHLQRQNRIRAALIRLGFQPGGADAAALAGVDPSTAELAANNSASALAQLGLQRGRGRADLSAELASRGLLDSGALRGGENMVQDAYNRGLTNATQDYLNEQNTALGDEASTIATGQTQFTAAKAAAAAAAAQNPLFTPAAGAPAVDYYPTLAPGQGARPEQTPILAKPPPVAPGLVKPPRYFTRPGQVNLRPGQKLRFTAGKGYYAA